jgi:hypothetical protein
VTTLRDLVEYTNDYLCVRQSRSRAFLVVRAAICGVAILSISALSISLAADPADSRLKDAEIIAFFRANRDVLERLRQMAMQDAGVISFIDPQTIEDRPLSQERRTEYKTLLRQLHRDIGIGTGSAHITFHLEGGGSVIERSWMKGLTYFPAAKKSNACIFVTSLDTRPKEDGTYLVPIEGDWYIVFGID